MNKLLLALLPLMLLAGCDSGGRTSTGSGTVENHAEAGTEEAYTEAEMEKTHAGTWRVTYPNPDLGDRDVVYEIDAGGVVTADPWPGCTSQDSVYRISGSGFAITGTYWCELKSKSCDMWDSGTAIYQEEDDRFLILLETEAICDGQRSVAHVSAYALRQ